MLDQREKKRKRKSRATHKSCRWAATAACTTLMAILMTCGVASTPAMETTLQDHPDFRTVERSPSHSHQPEAQQQQQLRRRKRQKQKRRRRRRQEQRQMTTSLTTETADAVDCAAAANRAIHVDFTTRGEHGTPISVGSMVNFNVKFPGGLQIRAKKEWSKGIYTAWNRAVIVDKSLYLARHHNDNKSSSSSLTRNSTQQVLMVAKDSITAQPAPFDNPVEESPNGGVIHGQFAVPSTVTSMTFLLRGRDSEEDDDNDDEGDCVVKLWGPGTVLLRRMSLSAAGGPQFQSRRWLVHVPQVKFFSIEFKGPGALDEVSFVPKPCDPANNKEEATTTTTTALPQSVLTSNKDALAPDSKLLSSSAHVVGKDSATTTIPPTFAPSAPPTTRCPDDRPTVISFSTDQNGNPLKDGDSLDDTVLFDGNVSFRARATNQYGQASFFWKNGRIRQRQSGSLLSSSSSRRGFDHLLDKWRRDHRKQNYGSHSHDDDDDDKDDYHDNHHEDNKNDNNVLVIGASRFEDHDWNPHGGTMEIRFHGEPVVLQSLTVESDRPFDISLWGPQWRFIGRLEIARATLAQPIVLQETSRVEFARLNFPSFAALHQVVFLPKSTCPVAAAVVVAVPSCGMERTTVDFGTTADGTVLHKGQVVDESVRFAGGLVVSARHRHGEEGGTVILDASFVGGETNSPKWQGPSLAILSADQEGGEIQLEFAEGPVTLHSIRFVNTETGGGTIALWDNQGHSIATYPLPQTGNGFQTVYSLPHAHVATVQMDMAGSGAITDVVFTKECHNDATPPLPTLPSAMPSLAPTSVCPEPRRSYTMDFSRTSNLRRGDSVARNIVWEGGIRLGTMRASDDDNVFDDGTLFEARDIDDSLSEAASSSSLDLVLASRGGSNNNKDTPTPDAGDVHIEFDEAVTLESVQLLLRSTDVNNDILPGSLQALDANGQALTPEISIPTLSQVGNEPWQTIAFGTPEGGGLEHVASLVIIFFGTSAVHQVVFSLPCNDANDGQGNSR